MKRRALLRSLVAVPAAAAVPAEAFAQQGRASAPANRDTPDTPTTGADAAADGLVKTFNQAQFSALRRLGEILMPAAQGTPGALESGAAEFLDFLIGVSPADRVRLYRGGLDRLNAEAERRYGKSFAEITVEQA
ncbi:MAG TPA: gluconate 2-dehydrogenase subunit 3 family protein, partial [Bryobacteraceae bacterium]|nr:gluconate 2-dehydrogenase subunit 3 family protein [Bryobacteraceae bacterium]